MRRFEYFEPGSLEEAVSLMSRSNGESNILAGGTDLLVEIREHLRWPKQVVNIKKIPNLDCLHYDEKTGLRFGANTTARSLEIAPFVIERYAGFYQAVRELGSIQVRNRATVAGNICRASPSADTLPPLIADGARITTFGPGGTRRTPLEEFFLGPGKTILAESEILTAISVPSPPPHTGKVYLKHGRRKAMELATVGVAVTLSLEGDRCSTVRIALGAVAPTPIRAHEAEDLLVGTSLRADDMARAATAAMEASRPIDDVRATAEYRLQMVGVLTARAVRQAAELAKRN